MRSIDVVMAPGAVECAGQDPLDLVRDYETQIAHLQALQVQALRRYTARHPGEFAAEEIAVELGWSPQTALRRLAQARALCERLPDTVAALRDGDIDWSKALRLLHAVQPLPVGKTRAVETWVLTRAAGKTVEQFAACARRKVIAVDPGGAAARAAARRAERRIWCQPLDDGMAEFGADLPAEDAAAAYHRIDLLARRATSVGDRRSMDQLRADVLTDLLLGDKHGRPTAQVHVNVTIDAATLAGLRDDPAHLHGYGPLDPATARGLAADGIWRRIITDPTTGTLLDIGRQRYRPPAALRDQVVLRDQRCRFPGCRRAAEHTDLDHTTPAAAGGLTSASNLAALCRRHHRMKHESRWQLHQHTPGVLTWTSPTGKTTTTTPETDDPPPY